MIGDQIKDIKEFKFYDMRELNLKFISANLRRRRNFIVSSGLKYFSNDHDVRKIYDEPCDSRFSEKYRKFH